MALSRPFLADVALPPTTRAASRLERARDEEIARALLDAGVRNSLDGVLDFEMTNGAPSETRRRTFRRFAFDSRNRASTASELDAEPHFARFARFGFPTGSSASPIVKVPKHASCQWW